MKKVFLGIFVVLCCLLGNVFAGFDSATSLDDEVFADSPSIGVVENLLILFNFDGEDEEAVDLYSNNSLYNLFDEVYNTGTYATYDYFKTISNDRIDFKTQIISQNQNAIIITVPKPREYFMPQSYKLNGEIISNPIGYINNDMCRMLREQELINALITAANPYVDMTNLDNNNDGLIDSLSFGVLNSTQDQSEMIDTWGILLWPHQIDNPALTPFLNTFDKDGKEIAIQGYYLDTYNIYEATTQNGYKKIAEDSTTANHELGHAFGLGDLYLDSGDSNLMGLYSHMCDSHTKVASNFYTSYEREKLGWLDNDNIKTITTEGNYTLNVVNGYDGDNIVAYKFAEDGDYDYYVEYRNSNRSGAVFDVDYSSRYDMGTSGLFVYKTNSSVWGNREESGIYEIENIYDPSTNQGQYINDRTLGAGESMSFGGYTINIVNVEEDNLTFSISGKDLLSQSKKVTVADVDNNILLYDRLLEQLSTDVLYTDSFIDEEKIDISGCNLTNLDFLTNFQLNSLKFLNASKNNITSIPDLSALTLPVLESVFLAYNNINLKTLNPTILMGSVFEFGVQQDFEPLYYNQTLSFDYYVKNGGSLLVLLNNNALVNNSDFSSSLYSFTDYNEYTIVVDFGGLFNSISKSFYFSKIGTIYDGANPFVIGRPLREYPQAKDLVQVEGIPESNYKITHNQNYLDLDQPTGCIDACVSVNGVEVVWIPVRYQVSDTLDIEFIGGSTQTIKIGEVYKEQGIIIRFMGDIQKYAENVRGVPESYCITYFKQDPNILVGDNYVSVSDISTTLSGKYKVCFAVTNKQGITKEQYKNIYVVGEIVHESEIDKSLYNALVSVCGDDVIYTDTFANYDYLNLQSYNIQYIKGFEKFIFIRDIIIDFGNNNLSNLNDLNALIKDNKKIEYISVMMNNFDINNLQGFDDQYPNVIFGVQKVKDAFFELNGATEKIQFSNDFLKYFDCNLYNDISNDIPLNNAGDISMVITAKADYNFLDLQKDFVLMKIANKQMKVVKEYNEAMGSRFEDMFTLEGKDINDLIITSDAIDYNFYKVDEIAVKYTIKIINNTSISYDVFQIVKIVDTTDPVLTIAQTDLYVVSYEQLRDLYLSKDVVAQDDYDGETAVYANVDEENNTITYTATDKNGNTAKFVQNIHIVKISLVSKTISAEVDTFADIAGILCFDNCEMGDFNFVYIEENKEIRNSFDIAQGIENKIFGLNKYTINAQHNNNEKCEFFFDIEINTIDNEKPVIEFLNNEKFGFTKNVGDVFPYITYRITDNSEKYELINDHLSVGNLMLEIKYYEKIDGVRQEIEKIDMLKKADYVIEYIATDYYGNFSKESISLSLVYSPVTSISMNMEKTSRAYKLGEEIKLSIQYDDELVHNKEFSVCWFVDGKLVQTTKNTLDTVLDLEEFGSYEIEATLESDGKTVTLNDVFTLKYKDINILEKYTPYFIAATSALILLIVVIYIGKKIRNRNFY